MVQKARSNTSVVNRASNNVPNHAHRMMLDYWVPHKVAGLVKMLSGSSKWVVAVVNG